QFSALRAFGVEVPLGYAIATLPIAFFIAVLPISVQGLGTTQSMMFYLFARYAPGTGSKQEAAIVAASLMAQVIAFGFQALLGVVCLRSPVGRRVAASAPRGGGARPRGRRGAPPAAPGSPASAT